MTVDAVHAAFEVDVLEVDRDPWPPRFALLFGRITERRPQQFAVGVLHHVTSGVEEIALPVALEDRLVEPAMSVKVGDLRLRQLPVERLGSGLGQEVDVGPAPAHHSALRVARLHTRLLRLQG